MGTAARILTILLAPSLVAGTVLYLPRLLRAVLDRLRRPDDRILVVGPPLERTAADLRRLLAEHEAVKRSPQLAVRSRRLVALEGALTDCALDAARALELPAPARPGREPLPRDDLRRLLGDLARSGVLLPHHDRFGR